MVQQGRTGGRTQHDSFHTVLVRPDDLRRKEPGADGDANGGLLVVASVPVLEGFRGCLRGMGEENSGLVCGAPGTSCRQHFAQGMNDSRTRKGVVV